MKLGVIADDFTGASDIALTLAEGGMPTVQYVGIPATRAAPDVAAGVVALKSRTIPVTDAVTQSLAACDWLRAQGAEQIIFKVCSTFDSTDAGNIGQVTEALANHLGETRVMVCPAFPENGRSVYQGHLFVNDKLLSNSGMENHPLTPMTDPDLRSVLSRQTTWAIGHVPAAIVEMGVEKTADVIEGSEPQMLVADAITNAHLVTLGKAIGGCKLITGGSGIALGLPGNFGFEAGSVPWQGVKGPGVVLSGSCSTATRGQVEVYKGIAASLEINADDVVAGKYDVTDLTEWVRQQDTPPMIYSSADPDVVAKAQVKHGREKVAHAVETLFADLAARCAEAGVARIVVAGGETSGAVVTGIKAEGLEIGPRIAAGVPALRVTGSNLVVALKSGNFGAENFFADALSLLEGRA